MAAEEAHVDTETLQSPILSNTLWHIYIYV